VEPFYPGDCSTGAATRLDSKLALPYIDYRRRSELGTDMKAILALVLVLYSAAAVAQGAAPADATAPAGSKPPTVGGKPLVQVKPRNVAAKPKHLSIAEKLQACLEIEDGTKGRLDCYDAIFPPKPNPKAPAAKAVADCRLTKEEDERLTCFNGFAESIPKF
jgi:hypothetical protein